MHYLFEKYLQKVDYSLDAVVFLIAVLVLPISALIATGAIWAFDVSSRL